MFRHPCHLSWPDLVHLNVNWVPQNFHPEEHKLANNIQKVIDF
jgi:hypothetical protein